VAPAPAERQEPRLREELLPNGHQRHASGRFVMEPLNRFLLAVTLVVIAGCTVYPVKDFSDHAIEINGNGKIVQVVPLTAPRAATGAGQSFARFSGQTDNFTPPIKNLFDKAGASGKDVLIFFHGGLVKLKDSMTSTNLLVRRYDENDAGELGGYYPLMINWDSGLWHSYFEHLLWIRGGEKWEGRKWGTVGVLSAPLYFLGDLGRTVAHAPKDMLYTLWYNLEAIPGIHKMWSRSGTNSQAMYHEILRRKWDGVSLGAARRADYKTPFITAWNLITLPFQVLLSPIVDGFGTPAWENMQRRTRNLDNRPKEFDVSGDESRASKLLDRPPPAVMTVFARQLKLFARSHPHVKITLVAHSMGTFIVNDLVRRTPNVCYANIIYMAGADSMRDTHDSLVPYLKRHKKTQFYLLTLHPQAEIEESHGAGFVPRGSLLVWIDDFFSSPLTYYDRAVGEWENVLQAYPEFTDVREQLHIKAFDQTSCIQQHGDFGSAYFWQSDFWKPGADKEDPWTKDFYTDIPEKSTCDGSP
jgi:pimeloyl-ACP methyl ester carboxylesterase